MAGQPDADAAGCRLYLVSPPAVEPGPFADRLKRALDGGDVACFQYWAPGSVPGGVPDDQLARAVDALMPIAQSRDVAFLLNDRPALARRLGCDGVHVTADEPDVAAVRRLLGDDLILGVSARNSRHIAMEAGENGADYVSFGPFFASGTKPGIDAIAPEIVQWWSEIFEIPSVAIGGMTPENCAGLVAAGADFIAAIGAVWDAADPAAAVAAFNRAIAAAQE